MAPDRPPPRPDPLLPATVRLFLAPEVAAALEVVVRQLHDQALDEGVAGLDSLPLAETRAAARELAACAARLERIGGYGGHMSLAGDEVQAVAAAGRAARELEPVARRLAAALEALEGGGG